MNKILWNFARLVLGNYLKFGIWILGFQCLTLPKDPSSSASNRLSLNLTSRGILGESCLNASDELQTLFEAVVFLEDHRSPFRVLAAFERVNGVNAVFLPETMSIFRSALSWPDSSSTSHRDHEAVRVDKLLSEETGFTP